MSHSRYSNLVAALSLVAAQTGLTVEMALRSDQYVPPPLAPSFPRQRPRSLKARDPEREAAAQAKRDRKAAKRLAQMKANHD